MLRPFPDDIRSRAEAWIEDENGFSWSLPASLKYDDTADNWPPLCAPRDSELKEKISLAWEFMKVNLGHIQIRTIAALL